MEMLVGSFRWALFAYAFFKFSALCLLGGILVRRLTNRDLATCVLAVECVLSAILLLDAADYHIGSNVILLATLQDHCSLYCDLLAPGFHGGPFIPALAAIALACMLLERRKTAWTAALSSLAAAAAFSDGLIWINFAFPAIAALLLIGILYEGSWKNIRSIVGAILIGACAAYFLEIGIRHGTFLNSETVIRRTLSWPAVIWHAALFWSQIRLYLFTHSLQTLETTISSLLFFMYGFTLFRKRENEIRRCAIFLWLYSAFALCFSFLAMIDVYEDFGSYRYLAPARFLLLPFAAFFISRLRIRRDFIRPLAACAAISLGAVIVTEKTVLPGSVTWKQSSTDCLETLSARYGLQAGIAQFWIALPLMLSSNETLQIVQVRENGVPYYWQNDRFWYTKSFLDPSKSPAYRFLLMNGLHPADILNRYGKPDRIASCPTSDVWIYDDAKRLQTKVFYPSESL
jgi:hypothetical protein